MKHRKLSQFLLLFFLSWFSLLSSAAPQGKLTGGIKSEFPNWFKESFLDIASDSEEAGEAGKHLILFMDLNNCPYCYKMLKENFVDAPHTDFIKEYFDVIQINIKGDREVEFDENTSVTEKELAGILKVSYTPTVIFLNSDNKMVLRLNGYRSPRAFEFALRYVKEKAYLRTSLNGYIDEQEPEVVYHFTPFPQYQQLTNLQTIPDKPLAIVVEDKYCDACANLYDGHFSSEDTRELLKKFTVVRLNALSTESIVDPSGTKTTIKEFVENLDLSYRPGIVLFDKGKEIRRIDTLLYTYHFQETLRYVGDRHYPNYPEGFYQYLGKRTSEILKNGRSIDLSK